MQKENKVCNITPANRVGSVQEYYFSRKLKEVAEMNAAGKNVINLGVGSPDLPPSERTIETLCEHARQPNEHGYQPYVGIPELRKGFADWYKKWYDVDLDPKTEIQPLIGSKEGILHISLAFLNPGEGVLVPNPGYPTYSSVSKLVEANLISYELKEELGWQPDFDEFIECQIDVDQLPQYADRSQRQYGTIRKAGRFRKEARDYHLQRQPIQLHSERVSIEHPVRTGSQRHLYRNELHE